MPLVLGLLDLLGTEGLWVLGVVDGPEGGLGRRGAFGLAGGSVAGHVEGHVGQEGLLCVCVCACGGCAVCACGEGEETRGREVEELGEKRADRRAALIGGGRLVFGQRKTKVDVGTTREGVVFSLSLSG
jgi:hypothetical protein